MYKKIIAVALAIALTVASGVLLTANTAEADYNIPYAYEACHDGSHFDIATSCTHHVYYDCGYYREFDFHHAVYAFMTSLGWEYVGGSFWWPCDYELPWGNTYTVELQYEHNLEYEGIMQPFTICPSSCRNVTPISQLIRVGGPNASWCSYSVMSHRGYCNDCGRLVVWTPHLEVVDRHHSFTSIVVSSTTEHNAQCGRMTVPCTLVTVRRNRCTHCGWQTTTTTHRTPVMCPSMRSLYDDPVPLCDNPTKVKN
jgi:hypothetical protein